MYISVADAAKKFNISKGHVRTLCSRGQIDGAKKEGGVWHIPSDAKRTNGARKKEVHAKARQSALDSVDKEAAMTAKQVCELLSISHATLKNWVRLGKLHTQADGKTFGKPYIEKLFSEIKSGEDKRLKKRRNKNGVNGNGLYKDYIKNENNIAVAEKMLDTCTNMSDEEIRIILAHFAVHFYCSQGGTVRQKKGRNIKFGYYADSRVFDSLLADLLGNIDVQSLDLTNIEHIFDYEMQFEPGEDTLGFIYISLRDLNRRKKTGAYYTPKKIVNILIDGLCGHVDFESKTVCDPCCGTGNFLMALFAKGVSASRLYGADIDEISVLIARINMFLMDRTLSKEHLDSHFVCTDALEGAFSRVFSVVLGNPPWGYKFSSEELKHFSGKYVTAKEKGAESYDLFVEKGLSMLEDGGYLAYVLPEAILSVASHAAVRNFVAENASFGFVYYLGNVFSGVNCPSVIMGLEKGGRRGTKDCRVLHEGREFVINKDRKSGKMPFSFNMNDDEYDCIGVIESVPHVSLGGGNAKFALGIVTGNNKKYVKTEKESGMEEVLKGNDIFRYSIRNAENYIRFSPEEFQQSAPEEIYRSEEKLFYRFICETPVFAYDDSGALSLNSCNILVPRIEGMDIKYVLAVLNSRVAAYYITKKFNSVKLLRTHIESVPVPTVSREVQNEIIKKTDRIINSKEDISSLYEELDAIIMDIFSLSEKERQTVRAALSKKNLFFLK